MSARVGESAAPGKTITRDDVNRAMFNTRVVAEYAVSSGMVPGLTLAVVHEDEVVFAFGFGRTVEGRPDDVTPETVFQLASMSKPMAATVVAALVDKKKVSWDTRIAAIDPGFQLHDAYVTSQVTIADLFAHRSGLFGDAGNELELLGFTRDEILHRLRFSKPESSFRSAYSYSNFGLTEGGVAAARAAGLAWEDAAQSLLYDPLGMTSTSSRHRDFLTRSNRASLHVRVNGKWTPLVSRDPDAQSPAGGVSSTVIDVAKWMRLELARGTFNGRPLIDPDALKHTKIPFSERGTAPLSGAPSFYGLGWAIEYSPYGVIWAHAGAFSAGARTVVSLIPSQSLGIVVLTNAFPTGVPEGLVDTFYSNAFYGKNERGWVEEWNAVFESLFGPAKAAAQKALGTPPAHATSSLPLPAYAGTYTNDFLGQVRVVEAGGSLALTMGRNGARSFPLKHFNRDVFAYFSMDDAPDWPVTATFEVGADGKARRVTLDDLDVNGQGGLGRVVSG